MFDIKGLFSDFINAILAFFRKPTTTTTTTDTTTTNIEITDTTTTQAGGSKMKVALCVGINQYPNPANNLQGCRNDCLDFADLLKNQYAFNEIKMLIDSEATLENVTSNIAALLAKKPDIFVMTNSSHGTRIPDTTGTEADGYCEAICLYNGFLLDHNFRQILAKADPKTHVVILSDSCHSAGVTREFLMTMNDFGYVSTPKYLPPEDNMEALRVSMMPITKAIFEPIEDMNEVLLAGCKSDQFSYDASFNVNGAMRPNGAFTYYTIQVLKENPTITYEDFVTALTKYLPSGKYPQCPVCETNSKMKKTIVFG